MTKNFEIANVPLFINYDSLKMNNQDIFFIQIQLIFDNYSEKINQIMNNNKNKHDEVIQETNKSLLISQKTDDKSSMSKNDDIILKDDLSHANEKSEVFQETNQVHSSSQKLDNENVLKENDNNESEVQKNNNKSNNIDSNIIKQSAEIKLLNDNKNDFKENEMAKQDTTKGCLSSGLKEKCKKSVTFNFAQVSTSEKENNPEEDDTVNNSDNDNNNLKENLRKVSPKIRRRKSANNQLFKHAKKEDHEDSEEDDTENNSDNDDNYLKENLQEVSHKQRRRSIANTKQSILAKNEKHNDSEEEDTEDNNDKDKDDNNLIKKLSVVSPNKSKCGHSFISSRYKILKIYSENKGQENTENNNEKILPKKRMTFDSRHNRQDQQICKNNENNDDMSFNEIEEIGDCNTDNISHKDSNSHSSIKTFNEIEEIDDSNTDDISHKDLSNDENEKLEVNSVLEICEFLAQRMFLNQFTNLKNYKYLYIGNFVPLFVMKFFNIEKIDNVDLQISSTEIITKQNIKNVLAVIEYLKSKDNAFKILTFSFVSENDKEASIILLLKTFLNRFYITKPRNEMIARLQIISSNLNSMKIYDNKDENYRSLIYLIKYLVQDPKKLKQKLENNYHYALKYLFCPEIFTKKHWNIIIQDKIYPDSYFYQLQLLFNKIDSYFVRFHVLEIIFTAKHKIDKIKVQRFDIIMSSIKVKKSFQDIDNQISLKHNDSDEIFNERKKKYGYKKHSLSVKYTERNKIKLSKDISGIFDSSSKLLQIEDIKEANSFWNIPNDDFTFSYGILLKKNLKDDISYDFSELITNESNIQISINESHNSLFNNSENLFLTHQTSKVFVSKLFKLFYYDENKNSWKLDSQSFKEFSDNKNFFGDQLTPLIFFANSNEDDALTINSHFLSGKCPDLNDEEQIFIYAFSEKNLAMMNIEIDFNDKEKFAIQPIFLLLHIPKSKQNISNLSIIIIQIYIFLFLICDLIISIVNEKTCFSQISSIKFFNSISQKYEFVEQSTNINNEKEKDNDDDDEDKNEEIQYDIKKINLNIMKTIFLLKNESHDFNLASLIDNNLKYNKMISEFKERPEIYSIDINDLCTYKNFLNKMTDVLSDSKTQFSDVKLKFHCMSYVKICSRYIKIKIANDLALLKNVINDRYQLLLSKQSNKKDFQAVLSQLYDERRIFTPQFDVEFQKVFQDELTNLKKSACKADEKPYQFELIQSAKLNYKKIEKSIQNKPYISKDQMERIIRNHKRFLQSELLDIIRSKSNNASYAIIYNENVEMLNEQFLKDKKNLYKIFEKTKNKFKQKDEVVQNDPLSNSKKKTNYVLKEIENLREIQVSVEIGKDLTTVIEQDF